MVRLTELYYNSNILLVRKVVCLFCHVEILQTMANLTPLVHALGTIRKALMSKGAPRYSSNI